MWCMKWFSILKILCYQMYYFLKCLLKWHQVIVNYCSKLLDVLQNHFYLLEQNYIYTLMFFYMYWYYSFHPSFSFPHSCVARVYKPTWTANYLPVTIIGIVRRYKTLFLLQGITSESVHSWVYTIHYMLHEYVYIDTLTWIHLHI